MNVEYVHSVFSAVYHGMCAQCLVMIQWNIGELHTKVLVIFLYITTLHSALYTIYLLQSELSTNGTF